jgi:enoyl reductase-like protein
LKAGVVATEGRSRVETLNFDTNEVTRYSIDADSVEVMLGGGAELYLSPAWRIRFAVHIQRIDERLLDARQGTLQAVSLELYRGL